MFESMDRERCNKFLLITTIWTGFFFFAKMDALAGLTRKMRVGPAGPKQFPKLSVGCDGQVFQRSPGEAVQPQERSFRNSTQNLEWTMFNSA